MDNDRVAPFDLSRKIADYVVEFKPSELSEVLIEKLKVSVIDTIAATLCGVSEEISTIIVSHVGQYYRGGQAGIIGYRRKANAIGAALANATMAHACDFDDSSLSMYGHASAAVLPAALAAGEMAKVSGLQFLAALTTGIETESQIGRLCGKRHFSLGWHSAATLGVVGAAAAAAKALELTHSTTVAAINLAASRACGMRESVGTMNKALQVGNASKSGVEAALLAAQGANAASHAFEGRLGFLALYCGDALTLDGALLNFERDPELINPGLCQKIYPCSGDIHSALDAILSLKREFDISAENISRIVCRVNKTAAANPSFPYPKGVTEAKFSFHFCLAAAMAHGKLEPAEFRNVVLNDVLVRHLMQRIEVRVLDESDEKDVFCSPAEVDVLLTDGRSFRRRVEWMHGHPANPMTVLDATRKLELCSSNLLSPTQLGRLINMIGDIHSLPDIGLLTKVTAPFRAH